MSNWVMFLPQYFLTPQQPARRYMPGAPEIYFSKEIDNSRLVKSADPNRAQELRLISFALAFVLLLIFGCQQIHLVSINCGRQIEEGRARLSELQEQNRRLRSEEAKLRSSEYLERAARQIGMERTGQTIHLDGLSQSGQGPVVAQVGVSERAALAN